MEPSTDQLFWMYETMLVTREFEETMVSIYLEGKLPPNHPRYCRSLGYG